MISRLIALVFVTLMVVACGATNLVSGKSDDNTVTSTESGVDPSSGGGKTTATPTPTPTGSDAPKASPSPSPSPKASPCPSKTPDRWRGGI